MLNSNVNVSGKIETRGIRGATVVSANTPCEIEKATVELTNEMLSRNSIKVEDIAFAVFTLTKDLNAAFPAKYARLKCGFDMVPMMCYQELDVPNSIQMCLRALFVVNTSLPQSQVKHVYLKGAKTLRADLERDIVK